jgi:hypothetical protein
LRPNFSAVFLDNSVHGRETYANAGKVFFGMEALEGLEKVFGLTAGKTRAVVTDVEWAIWM